MEEIKKEGTKQEVAVKEQRNMVANLSEGIYSSSDTFKLATSMAKGLAASTVVPMQYQRNEANCLVAIEMANRLGVSPLQVMQNLDVIQGNPAWKGKALIAFINNSHKYDDDLHFEYEYDKEGFATSCYAWTKKGDAIIKGTKYTLEMAKKAGLLAKNNSYWIKEPDLMLSYRAASRFASLNCPEISMGIYTTDEMNEIVGQGRTKSSSLNDVLAAENVVDAKILDGEVVDG